MPIRSCSCSARRCSGTTKGTSAAPGTAPDGAGIDRHRHRTRSSTGGAVRPAADEDRRPGEQGAAQRRPLAPHGLAALRPLGLDQVVEHETGRDDVADAVAQRAVVLDVGRHARGVDLDVRRAVEVGLGDGQPVRARVVGEHPAHRVVHREHPPAAGPQHPGDLAHHPLRLGHERHRAERRAGQVERCRRRRAAARRRPAREEQRHPSPRWTVQRVAASRPTGRGPPAMRPGWRASARTARTRSRPPARGARRHVAEQARVGLAQALRAPDEVDVADVCAVLGQVVVGVGVPPGAARPLRLRRTPTARRATAAVPSSCSRSGHSPATRCPRWPSCPRITAVRRRGRVALATPGRVASSTHCGQRGACSQTVVLPCATLHRKATCSRTSSSPFSTSQPEQGDSTTSQSVPHHEHPPVDHPLPEHPTTCPPTPPSPPPPRPRPRSPSTTSGRRRTSSPPSTRRSSTSTMATSSRARSSRSTATRSCSTSATRPRGSSPPANSPSSTMSTPQRSCRSASTSRPLSSRRRTRRAG